MSLIGYIAYGLLWIVHILFSFIFFQKFNISAAIPCIFLVGIGAWLFSSRTALLIALFALIYAAGLCDFYGDIFVIYQAKAFTTFSLITVVLLVGAFKKKHHAVRQLKVILDRKVEERTKELHQLIEQLITDDENLRRTLGQDIHDELGQNLTGLLLLGSSIQDDMERVQSDDLPRIQRIVSHAQHNLQLARKVSRTLFPFKMMETGLEAALDELTSCFSETNDIRFEIRLDGSEGKLPERVVIHFYRIAYECILNAIHYGTPDAIRFILRSNKTHTCLRAEIEGRMTGKEMRDNMFVEMMRYRIKSIQGDLNIPVASPETMVFSCSAPIEPNRAPEAFPGGAHG